MSDDVLVTEELDGPSLLSVSRIFDNIGRIRASGRFVSNEGIVPYSEGEESESAASVSEHVTNSLLCSGMKVSHWANLPIYGLHSKKPSSYQLIPMDLMSTPWLDVLIPGRFPRTRLLVSDEGGLGKTLATSLAIAKTYRERRGVIFVICPSRLRNKWRTEIDSCLREDGQPVRILKSANNHRMSSEMDHGIYVISKHSIMNRWIDWPTNRDWIPKCELVVIDEAHQGKETSAIEKPLFDCQREFCIGSESVMALTASPYSTGKDDLMGIFRMMGGETAECAKRLSAIFQHGWEGRFSDANTMLLDGLSKIGGNLDDARSWIKSFDPILRGLISWMEPDDLDEVMTALNDDGPLLISRNENMEGFKLLRDLHPFGRFFSIVRRSDLGQSAGEMFRDRTDEFHRIELHPDHSVVVNSLGGGDAKIAASWTQNSMKGNDYSIISSLAPPEPSEDPRWKFVLDQIRGELNRDDELTRGAVIFVDYLGTLKGMNEQLKEEFGDDDRVGIFQLSGGEGNRRSNQRAPPRGDVEASKASRRGKFPILICTASGGVGLDMEWATIGVMWDVNSNPETLSQRTWRLDRRQDPNSPMGPFRILHIQNEKNQSFIDRMNESHASSSSILGRSQDPFIPEVTNDLDNEKSPRKWSDHRGVFALTDGQAKEIAVRAGQFQQQQLVDYDSFEILPKLDLLFWALVKRITGLPIENDELESGIVCLSDSTFFETHSSISVDSRVMRLIWELSNICSINEMSMLWRLSANSIKVPGEVFGKHRFNLRYSILEDNNFGQCRINREGTLSSSLRNQLIDSSRNQGLLRTGPGSPFLAWIDQQDIGGPNALVVNLRWLELFSKHRRVLQSASLFRAPVPSPIMAIEDFFEEPNLVEFIEDSVDYEYSLHNVLDFSLANSNSERRERGFYLGEYPGDGKQWPVLGDDTVEAMRASTEKLAGELMEDLLQSTGSDPINDLFRDLRVFIDEGFQDYDVIPLFLMEVM